MEGNANTFLEQVLEIGRRMVMCGTEVGRVEDTLTRILKAYGYEVTQVYAITSLIVITMKDLGGTNHTQSVRIHSTAMDLGQLEELNSLARKICKERPPVEEIIIELDRNQNRVVSKKNTAVGYILAASAFTIFFGGGIVEAIVSGVIGFGIYVMDRSFRLREINRIIYIMTACFLSGCAAYLFLYVGILTEVDKVMIGDVMLFIPTLSIVNGIKELFYRDIMSGLFRMIEAMMVAFCIAFGYACAVFFVGGIV